MRRKPDGDGTLITMTAAVGFVFGTAGLIWIVLLIAKALG